MSCKLRSPIENLGVHHGKPVTVGSAERQRWIELFYLPSYSLEMNPAERHLCLLGHFEGVVHRSSQFCPARFAAFLLPAGLLLLSLLLFPRHPLVE
jgi:hypothetical protein